MAKPFLRPKSLPLPPLLLEGDESASPQPGRSRRDYASSHSWLTDPQYLSDAQNPASSCSILLAPSELLTERTTSSPEDSISKLEKMSPKARVVNVGSLSLCLAKSLVAF
ncbi:hypothetical protein M406DRAFT_356056 [Cryphonectria parasitica EP155]|uniref:Uncharacterized protein n=1 Tax=Cryphonectria parasitica (strain ATCC 38755 / EP155) TaxID=660469 RepID=A0A9P4Y3P2_CRYP1|nr:uncharacterized protein M406DRAFT_356056 [Cryphonectria parasitica EP155]KAF3765792.1 hypothetical protein M406DRAFT_356056 [Cryphonectria parasitica EP155]